MRRIFILREWDKKIDNIFYHHCSLKSLVIKKQPLKDILQIGFLSSLPESNKNLPKDSVKCLKDICGEVNLKKKRIFRNINSSKKVLKRFVNSSRSSIFEDTSC